MNKEDNAGAHQSRLKNWFLYTLIALPIMAGVGTTEYLVRSGMPVHIGMIWGFVATILIGALVGLVVYNV